MIHHVVSALGAVLLWYGIRLIGKKQLKGFYFALAGEALWILWGVFDGAWELVAMSLVFSWEYFGAVRNWKKDEKKDELSA